MNERPTLQAWAEVLAAFHEDFFRRKPDAEMVPMFFLDGPDGMEIIAAPWRDADEKYQVIGKVRRYLASNLRLDRYAVTSEVWVASTTSFGPDSDVFRLAKQQKLHTYAGREEAVFTFCIARALPLEPVLIWQKVARGARGEVRRLVRQPGPPAVDLSHVDGAFANLFDPPTQH